MPRLVRAALLALPLLLLGVTEAAAELPPAAVRLEEAVRGAKGIRAEFVQIREVEISGEEVQGRGTLAFRPPASFRLAYTAPETQEIVVTGDTLWVVLPAEAQAIHYPFSIDAPGSEIFLLFGGGNASLDDVFEITQETWAGHADALRIEPRNTDPGYPLQDIRVLVGEDGFPKRLFYREITGDTVVFTFTRIVAAPPDLDADLRLDLPEGVDIIEGAP